MCPFYVIRLSCPCFDPLVPSPPCLSVSETMDLLPPSFCSRLQSPMPVDWSVRVNQPLCSVLIQALQGFLCEFSCTFEWFLPYATALVSPGKTSLVHPIPLCVFHITVIRNLTGGHSEEYGCQGPKRAFPPDLSASFPSHHFADAFLLVLMAMVQDT